MPVIRIILIGILVGILFSFYRKFQKQLLTHKKRRTQKQPKSPTRMLRCEHCGVYIPESDVIKEGVHVYCSHEHRDINANK